MTKKKNSGLETMRPTKIKRKAVKSAEGSALITMGGTSVLCAASVEEGRPRWMRNEARGWVTAEYGLLPRSTSTRTRRERGSVSGRTQEIQRLIGRSLRAVTNLEAIDNYTIIVDCDVIEADGGTRCASITGGFVALYDACRSLVKSGKIENFPITDLCAAISVGIWKGAPVLDLDYEKDSSADVDMNIVMTGSGKMIEIQGTAEGEPFSRAQLDRLIGLAAGGIGDLFAIQRKVLGIK